MKRASTLNPRPSHFIARPVLLSPFLYRLTSMKGLAEMAQSLPDGYQETKMSKLSKRIPKQNQDLEATQTMRRLNGKSKPPVKNTCYYCIPTGDTCGSELAITEI